MKRHYILSAILILAAAHACADCPAYVRAGLGGDYTDAGDRQGLEVVEHYHFSKRVENLVHGMTSSLGDDIHYTLSVFPNHHRALNSMAKLALREKSHKATGAKYSVDCYFERAIRFKHDDPMVRMIYGSYLMAAGDNEQALAQLSEAARLNPEHPTVHYNLGLMYVKKKDYAQARIHAQKAYELGVPLPGLKNKLIAAGQWQDLPQKAAAVKEVKEINPE